MTSIMQIDTIGKRYGLLPSEVIKRADSFDLFIMDGKEPIPEYSEKELLKIHKGK